MHETALYELRVGYCVVSDPLACGCTSRGVSDASLAENENGRRYRTPPTALLAGAQTSTRQRWGSRGYRGGRNQIPRIAACNEAETGKSGEVSYYRPQGYMTCRLPRTTLSRISGDAYAAKARAPDLENRRNESDRQRQQCPSSTGGALPTGIGWVPATRALCVVRLRFYRWDIVCDRPERPRACGTLSCKLSRHVEGPTITGGKNA